MAQIWEYLFVIVFMISSAMLALYGLHLYVLVYLFRRKSDSVRRAQAEAIETYTRATPDDQWPGVTTQLPVYNEAEVAVRIMEAAAAMDYPKGKHTIQVLDDSTDETRFMVDRTARRLRRQGVDIQVVRRENRQGYKAGALKEAMRYCRHPFIAIFDSDFVPPREFLRRAVPLMVRDEKLACLQGRWAHLNDDESWMTRAQSVGIDGHFAIEQGARAWNNLLMNFNGTAGIWRKAAIEDPAAGGWSADTLTEDLDLSYRVQLAGWRIDYCLDLPCPAELPNTINALKAQQRRWATGSIQTAVKLLPRIWKSKAVTFCQKLEATVHLTHYSVALWMLFLALIARPMLVLIGDMPLWWCFVFGWVLILLSAIAPPVVYGYARYSLGGGWTGLRTIPAMMLLGTGLSINNGMAVIRGLYEKGGEFVRTPKSGSTRVQQFKSRYRAQHLEHMWFTEMLLGAYCLANWAIYLSAWHRIAFSVFLIIYAMAFLTMGWISRPEASWKKRSMVLVDESDSTATLPGGLVTATATPVQPGSAMAS